MQRVTMTRPLDGLTAFVMDVSYFSGKLEAYLRYKGIPYERVEVGWRRLETEIHAATGAAQVPALRFADGTWMTDSTPTIEWLERQTPAPAIVPADPLQSFFVRVLEDYADEWLWRPALHYRWSFAPDRRLLGERIAREVLYDVPGPVWLKAIMVRRRQRRRYVRGDGVTPATRAHVERIYLATLERLEAILAEQPFLLGTRPCLADFGFFASMFRHFALDPTPARLMRDRAPHVWAWVARLWAARAGAGDGAFVAPGTLPHGWGALLDDAGTAYLPYLAENAAAWAAGAARFDYAVQGVTYRGLRPHRYRVWCRERLQQAFDALPAGARAPVEARLAAHGCWEPLWRHGRIPSGHQATLEPRGP
jgi:glutathione S-transferase